MLTDREQKLVNWLRTRKVATMRHLQHQFQVCHMTVFRALKKAGYHTSCNRNAGYYTLADVPQFDDWGLWAYPDVRFSHAGTLQSAREAARRSQGANNLRQIAVALHNYAGIRAGGEVIPRY
jgi:DeoR/GlpR family transcriptional regulator of sugar metabolism